MFRPLSMIFAARVALLRATAAHAGTHWSVGINLPVPGVVVTNGATTSRSRHRCTTRRRPRCAIHLCLSTTRRLRTFRRRSSIPTSNRFMRRRIARRLTVPGAEAVTRNGSGIASWSALAGNMHAMNAKKNGGVAASIGVTTAMEDGGITTELVVNTILIGPPRSAGHFQSTSCMSRVARNRSRPDPSLPPLDAAGETPTRPRKGHEPSGSESRQLAPRLVREAMRVPMLTSHTDG
jgi:hypothetical protein